MAFLNASAGFAYFDPGEHEASSGGGRNTSEKSRRISSSCGLPCC